MVPDPAILADPLHFPAWLVRFVSAPGMSCEQAIFRVDGWLVFVMQHGAGRTRVVWKRFASGGDGRPVQGGTLCGAEPAAVDQVAQRLDALFAFADPPLLSVSPAARDPLSLTADAISLRLAGKLEPDMPICGPYRYLGCEDDASGNPVLVCSGKTTEHRFHLGPRDLRSQHPVLADVGPVSLAIERVPEDPDGRRLAGLIGFVLRLCIDELSRLDLEAPADPDRVSMLDESYDDELAVFESIGASVNVAVVGSVERECLHCVSGLDTSRAWSSMSPLAVTALASFTDRLRFVDPAERDVIMQSAEEALPPLLREAAGNDEPDVLVVIDSCMSRIKGDATEQVVLEEQAALPVPAIYLDGSVAELSNYPQFWRRLLDRFVRPAPATTNPSVNLIGYAGSGDGCFGDLAQLLDAAGIGVNLSILPSFDTRALERFDRAWADVLCPAHQVRDGFRDVPVRDGAPRIAPPAPCGPDSCRAWLDAVRGACHMPPLADAEFGALVDSNAAEWPGLVAQARQRGIGIVLVLQDLAAGVPRLRWGIPWIEVLEEMGFCLTFVLLADQEGPAEPFDLERLLPFLRRPAAHRQRRLRGFEALADEPFELVYSERYRDTRVTRAGKIPFSVKDFSLGLQGACRSLGRLLRLGGITFHRTYAPRTSEPAP